MYYVRVQGESIADLKEGLERHLRELSGVASVKSVSVTTSLAPVAPDEVEDVGGEEMEVVPSPFAKTTPAPALNTVVDNEVDAEGIPWDSRIHASSKAKVKDGTWRTQRGVDQNLVFQVKNELRARVQGSAPVVQAPVVAPVAAPVVQAPVVAPAPVAPMPTMQQSGHTLDTFKAQFPMVIAGLITEGKIDQNYVNSLKTYFNVAEIWQANDEQKAMMFDQFVQYGFVQRVG